MKATFHEASRFNKRTPKLSSYSCKLKTENNSISESRSTSPIMQVELVPPTDSCFSLPHNSIIANPSTISVPVHVIGKESLLRKAFNRITGREAKNDLGENLSSIEPSKIIHTYSRSQPIKRKTSTEYINCTKADNVAIPSALINVQEESDMSVINEIKVHCETDKLKISQFTLPCNFNSITQVMKWPTSISKQLNIINYNYNNDDTLVSPKENEVDDNSSSIDCTNHSAQILETSEQNNSACSVQNTNGILKPHEESTSGDVILFDDNCFEKAIESDDNRSPLIVPFLEDHDTIVSSAKQDSLEDSSHEEDCLTSTESINCSSILKNPSCDTMKINLDNEHNQENTVNEINQENTVNEINQENTVTEINQENTVTEIDKIDSDNLQASVEDLDDYENCSRDSDSSNYEPSQPVSVSLLRRGRKRKIEPITIENNRKRKRKTETEQDDVLSIPFQMEEELSMCDNFVLICGKCSKSFSDKETMLIHICEAHNGLARPQGESQIFCEEAAIKLIGFAYKKLVSHYKHRSPHISCEMCQKSFTTAYGLQYHYKNKVCNDSIVQCKNCLRTLKSNELYRHQQMNPDCQNSKAKLRKKRQRLAKIKRDKNISNSDESQEYDHGDAYKIRNNTSLAKEFDDVDVNIRKFFSFRQAFKIDNDILIEEFKNQLKDSKTASCINEDCNCQFSECKKLRMHLKICSKAPLTYFCSLCKFKASSISVIKEHITSTHDKYLSVSDKDENHKTIENADDQPVSPTKISRRIQSNFEVYYKAREMTLKFRKDNYARNIFQKFQTKKVDWKEVDDTEMRKYLPSITDSPYFKLINSDGVAHSKNEFDAWTTLTRFKGMCFNSEKVIFCGGPVSCVAWCPVSDNCLNVDQFVAISAQGDPDDTYPLSGSRTHEGLLQIWNCGQLESNFQPKMCFSIAHKFGLSWALSWCPSGIFDEGPQSINYPRLGLLASCFSDGSIRLFTIPKFIDQKCVKEYAILDKMPDLSLLTHNVKDIQCINMSWLSSKGHELIAGCFTNGTVSIWNLVVDNELLRETNSQGLAILYPIRSLKAHQGVCSTVSFCPSTHGQHILTGGSDRIIKFWDLTKPDHPLAAARKGLATQSSWLSHWAGAMVSFDDVFSLAKTCTTFRENGFFGLNHRHILATNATVYGIATSEWHNALVHVDDGGEVVMSFQHSLMCTNQNEKHNNRKRFPLFSTKLENLQTGKQINLLEEYQNDGIGNDTPDCKTEKKINVDTSEARPSTLIDYPSSYKAVSKEFGIKFVSHTNPNCYDLQLKQYSHLMDPGPLTIYPLNGATAVSWNDNFDSNSWIIVGMKSGLCRIIKVPLPTKRKANN